MDEEKELNPKKSPDEKSQETPLAPVVTGKAEVRKKSEAKKLAETLFKGDLTQVRRSLWKDVIIPAFQDTLWSMLERAGRGLIFGDSEPRRRRDDERGIPARQIDFTRYSRRPEREERRYEDPDRKDLYDYGYIWFEYERDAEAVLMSMKDILRGYGWVSVAQTFELSGNTSKYTDRDFGWRDLRDTDIVRARDGGYMLRLPRPRPYD
jgi:hypothetical protein